MQHTSPEHIHHTIYKPEGPIKAAILLLHGMQEHSGRYVDFSRHLQAEGYAVLTYDHRGHGKTAKTEEQTGFFGRKKPDELLISDARQMARFLLHCHPGVPMILMGHSMGSFIARLLLHGSAHLFNGTILMGTGGPNFMATLFHPILYITNIIASKKRSKWLNSLFNSINNRPFRHEQPHNGTNWLSANTANRNTFLEDKLCGLDFSNNAFHGLIALNVKATQPSWATNIPLVMPMLFISGCDDPIGQFGKGVQQTVDNLKNKGFRHVEMRLYPGMRHEILHEDERDMVYNDIVAWLDIHFPKNS